MSSQDDPVVAALREVEKQYQSVVIHLHNTAEAEHKEAVKQHLRAQHLQDVIQNIHRGLFSGDTYMLILESCLNLTKATRGLYLTLEGAARQPRIQASIGNGDYFGSDISPFLTHLCEQAAGAGETLVFNRSENSAAADAAAVLTGNSFHNFIAAPVVLMRGLSGVIVAADKENGDFEDDDVQTLIHIGSQAGAAIENAELRRKLQRAYLATVSVLADAMEAKDPYTRGHCEMVSRFARLIARRLELTAQEQSIVGYAALLHDIGKIGVSDGILNKPTALLPEEREVVRSHVRVGHDLIRHVPTLSSVADAVLHHHEWFDGTGYPDGLQGDRIPIASRIVCVVDSYGAMITRRSYKEAYGEDYALAELLRCAGSQFDPHIVEVFAGILTDPPPDHAEEDEEDMISSLPDILMPGKDQDANKG